MKKQPSKGFFKKGNMRNSAEFTRKRASEFRHWDLWE